MRGHAGTAPLSFLHAIAESTGNYIAKKNLTCDIKTRQLGDVQGRSSDYSASQRMIRIRARSFRANAKVAPLSRATRYTL